MKKVNKNSLKKYIKFNKENCIKSNNTQGITLIALIVTIVVMIVVAGVTINMTIGENGIFTKAVKAKEMQEAAEVKERLELKQLDARLALGGENMTLENYLKYLVDQGMIDESDIEDTEDSNVKTILVDDKYMYTVVKKDDGTIELEYEGKAGKLLPKIKSVNTKSTTSSIEVKVDATRVDGGEYRFYIKDVTSGEDYKKKGTNKTGEYTFTGLEQNKEFRVKVEVENKNGIAEKETSIIRTVTVAELTQADLEFIYNPNDWTKDKIVVTVNAKIEIPEGYTLQTSKDMTKWENTTTQEFTENGYIYVRLFDGTNGGSYAVGEVTKIDTEKPKVTTTSSTSNSITFSGTDNASGIIGYAVTTTKVEPTNFVAVDNTKALNNITIGERSQKTEYYVWLKDKAENVSEPVTIKTNEATGITQADINFTYSPSEWTKGKVTVTASLKTTIPTGYTLQTSKDATNWESKATQEFTANGYIYVRLYDGTNGGSYAVGEVSKIDKDAPTITISSSNVDSNRFTLNATVQDTASGLQKIEWYYKKSTDTKYTKLEDSFSGETTSLTKTKEISSIPYAETYNAFARVYDVATNSKDSNVINIALTTPVAQIGNVGYSSLQKAIYDVQTNNIQTTVTLLADTTDKIYVEKNKNVRLNLNGKTLIGSTEWETLLNKGTLILENGTIKNSTNAIEYGGIIYNDGNMLINSGNYVSELTNNPILIAREGSTTTINNGTFLGTQDAIQVQGTLNIKNGTIQSNKSKGIITNASTANVTIEGGDIVGAIGIYITEGKVNVKNGTIKGTLYDAIVKENGNSTVTVSDGTIIGQNNGMFIYQEATGEIIINGGNFYGNTAGIWEYGTSTIIVNDGKIEGGNTGITIAENGTINMYGGTAKGENYDGICLLKSNATANIGNPSSVVDSTSPILIGKNYGIAVADGSTANFYKGSLQGDVAGYNGTVTPRNGYTLQTVQIGRYYKTTLK